MKKVFIIAEAGVNHNGSLERAMALIDAAAACGADAVKFQTFAAERLLCADAPKAGYQRRTTPAGQTQFAMIRRLQLSRENHLALLRRCRRRKIIFLSSPFDVSSAGFLRRLGLRIFKIPSGEITNLPYLRAVGSFRRKILLSTGMSTLSEIKQALAVLVKAGTVKSKITVLHCTSEYPAPFAQANLLSIPYLAQKLGVRVGYSDHTPGIEASLAAVALGAEVIEKHFTLDRSLSGPDHAASLSPGQLRALVQAVRHLELALGERGKKVFSCERRNLKVVRKSIVASRPIGKGEVFSADNITAKRPAAGMSPMLWDLVIGRKAERSFREDERIII